MGYRRSGQKCVKSSEKWQIVQSLDQFIGEWQKVKLDKQTGGRPEGWTLNAMGLLDVLKLPFVSLLLEKAIHGIARLRSCFAFSFKVLSFSSSHHHLGSFWRVSSPENQTFPCSAVCSVVLQVRVSGPSLRTDTNSDGWLYFLPPKSFILKTVHQALKEFQHLPSTWWLLRVERCYMWDTAAEG